MKRNEEVYEKQIHRPYCMCACETQILQRLAVLWLCHRLTVGKAMPHYILVQRPMPWSKAQDFCQRHYINLAVLNTEEQYLTLCNATASNRASVWLGLHRQNYSSAWKWVDGEELTYENWYISNYESCCASLEAMLKEDKKLLARYCEETHMFICQGPVSPQSVTVDSAGSDQVTLSWNISAFMQMTPHSYNVTLCANTCDTLTYHYAPGSTSMTITVSNLTSATEFIMEISAFIVRPDSSTGEKMMLQSNTTALKVRTVDHHGQSRRILVVLRLIKPLSLAPPLWVIYHILKKYEFKESARLFSTNEELSAVEIETDLIPEKARGTDVN